MYQLDRLSMTSPCSITTGGRAAAPVSARRSTWVLNRSPLAMTSGIAAGTFGRSGTAGGGAGVPAASEEVGVGAPTGSGGAARSDVVDEVADGHGDDLVQLLLGEPADEVDLVAVALEQLLGQGHELDALDLEVVVERGARLDLDVEQVLLADDFDEQPSDLLQDAFGGVNQRSRQRRAPSPRVRSSRRGSAVR